MTPTANVNQPEEEQRFHRHDGHDVPVVALYAERDAEGERHHWHEGQKVPVMVLYSEHPDIPDIGVLCPVCEFCPSPESEAYQLASIMSMYHFEDC